MVKWDKLQCPHCGNDDVKNKFGYTDRPTALRRVLGFENGTLIVSADYEVEYGAEMGENDDLIWCWACNKSFRPACKIDTL